MLHGQASAITLLLACGCYGRIPLPLFATTIRKNKETIERPQHKRQKAERRAHHKMSTCQGIMLGIHDTLTFFLNCVFPYPIKLCNVPRIYIAHVASLLLDFSKSYNRRASF
jgi:hypothetical protein